jgi:5-methylcytosine-specific restriction protein A
LPTNSEAWRRIRAIVLSEQPLCEECNRQNRTTGASVVDHINGDASDNRRENLQSLCPSCHSKKTAKEDGGFGNARGGAGQKSTASLPDSRPKPYAHVRANKSVDIKP